jgi:hypothetical protein
MINSGVRFGENINYDDVRKWLFIRKHINAMIKSGIIVGYTLEDAMYILYNMNKIYKLICAVSMIECGGTMYFSTRILTEQRNKKEDEMFATLEYVKHLLRRGAFAIFAINLGITKCIKVHPGMVKFDTAAFSTTAARGPIDPQVEVVLDDAACDDNVEALEKLDGHQINCGGFKIDGGVIIEIGNKDTCPTLVYIPKKNYVKEMQTAADMHRNSTYAPYMAFNILADAVSKYPKLINWLTQHTCIFELLNRRMFEIYIGSEFNKLNTPELVLLSVFQKQKGKIVKIPISKKMRKIFRTPRRFTIGSHEFNKFMSFGFRHEGVVVIDKHENPVLKKKTPAFVFWQVLSKLRLPVDMTRDELYVYVVNIVMAKCYSKGADPDHAKQFYIDNADMMSRIVYKIACDFACGKLTIADITDPITGESCNWGKIISSVIMSLYAERGPISLHLRGARTH